MGKERIEILGKDILGNWSVSTIAAEDLPNLAAVMQNKEIRYIKTGPNSYDPQYPRRTFTDLLVSESVFRQLFLEDPNLSEPKSTADDPKLLDILDRFSRK